MFYAPVRKHYSMSEALETRVASEFDIGDRTGNTGLDRMRNVTSFIPDSGVDFTVIHVAGTNGKGSVANFIYEALRNAGESVGISSDLVSIKNYNHNIRVNGKSITDAAYLRLARDIMRDVDETPSEYELRIAVAIAYFMEQDVTFGVIEAGIGGEFDATNVLHDDISVITTVGRDHANELGDDREAIAKRKAGIIDPGGKVVSRVSGKPGRVISQVTESVGCEEITSIADVSFSRCDDGVAFDVTYGGERTPSQLVAGYQTENVETAVTVLETLDEIDSKLGDVVSETVAEFTVPGRMEVVQSSPCVVVDGGHNPLASRAVADAVADLNVRGDVWVVFASLTHLEWREMATVLADEADTLVVTCGSVDRDDAVPERITKNIEICETRVNPDVTQAIDDVLCAASTEDVVVVTGYLGFAGDSREVLL